QRQLRNDKRIITLEQEMLRNQMNPHFIFNSLNSIKLYIINNEKENAVYYLNKFSKLIRKILSSSMVEVISLNDELETTELYVNIENIRFNNTINFQMRVEEDINLESIKIPSLILQPFLENSIWHGLSSKNEDRQLRIHVEKEQSEFLKIEIQDNGIGRKKAGKIKQKKIHKRNSVGIAITEERLKNFAQSMHNDYDLQFIDLYDDNDEPTGTKVILKFPLK
ncbi:MAG: histidine kinase, partial [Bacteroidia bacterium]|nr:histidine kinase [Bacteroidia bacterium]